MNVGFIGQKPLIRITFGQKDFFTDMAVPINWSWGFSMLCEKLVYDEIPTSWVIIVPTKDSRMFIS